MFKFCCLSISLLGWSVAWAQYSLKFEPKFGQYHHCDCVASGILLLRCRSLYQNRSSAWGWCCSHYGEYTFDCGARGVSLVWNSWRAEAQTVSFVATRNSVIVQSMVKNVLLRRAKWKLSKLFEVIVSRCLDIPTCSTVSKADPSLCFKFQAVMCSRELGFEEKHAVISIGQAYKPKTRLRKSSSPWFTYIWNLLYSSEERWIAIDGRNLKDSEW